MKPTLALLAALIVGSAAADAARMAIPEARRQSYPGSALTVRQNLPPGVNYSRQVVTYRSDGLRIQALLTVPRGTPPPGGWPAVVFNHGYIPPAQYRTTERYVAYQDAFARAGFVTLKSDYRGHGDSEGEPASAYYAPDYTNDVLNATASLRRDARVNAARIGMWGHSMGGFLTLRAMTIDPGIKAGVIWAGVVGDYRQLAENWQRTVPFTVPPPARRLREAAYARYGDTRQNPAFWYGLSPTSYLRDLGGPLQLHIGSADAEVPPAFHTTLAARMRALGLPVESFVYPGDDHNLSRNLNGALARSVAFFQRHL